MKAIELRKNLWFGPRPFSVTELLDNGFDVDINLQSGAQDKFTNDKYEEQRITGDWKKGKYSKRHFEFHEIKCSNIFPPTEKQIEQFVKLVDGLLARGLKIFVHCHSGVDRTGIMMAIWGMVREGWGYTKALIWWIRNGRHWWFWWWKRTLKKYKNRVGNTWLREKN